MAAALHLERQVERVELRPGPGLGREAVDHVEDRERAALEHARAGLARVRQSALVEALEGRAAQACGELELLSVLGIAQAGRLQRLAVERQLALGQHARVGLAGDADAVEPLGIEAPVDARARGALLWRAGVAVLDRVPGV